MRPRPLLVPIAAGPINAPLRTVGMTTTQTPMAQIRTTVPLSMKDVLAVPVMVHVQ